MPTLAEQQGRQTAMLTPRTARCCFTNNDLHSDSQLNQRKRSPSVKNRFKKKRKSGTCDNKDSLTTKGFKRHFAEHNYHDYSHLRSTDVGPEEIKGSRGGVHKAFPVVLHQMMEESDDREFSQIVSWQSHGRAFLIHEPKTFVDEVLPKYFKHSKLSSFQRQLSLYGFVRLTQEGRDRGAYYHECFLRGRPFLCCKIQRTRVKGTWVRTSSSPESEPGFYTMEPVGDLDDTRTYRGEYSSTSSVDGSESEGHESENSSDFDTEKNVHCASALCPGEQDSRRSLMEAGFEVRNEESSRRHPPVGNHPLPEAGLQPPPAFPSAIISNNFESLDPIKESMVMQSLDHGASCSSATSFTHKVHPFMNAAPLSLASSLSANFQFSPFTDDVDLAHFLTDVDLDADFDCDEVIQISSI